MPILMAGKFSSSIISQICDNPDIVVYAEDADEAIALLRHESYDLVLIGMAASSPEDGFDLIRRLRASENDTPVLALTGSRAHDRVEAVGLGADEALADPVNPVELRGRIRSILRRHRAFGRPALRLGHLRLCLIKREASFREAPLNLTAREFSILELLLLRRGSILTKTSFLDYLYGGTDEPDGRIMDVFLCKLRKKLERAGAGRLIGVVRGRGYIISELEALRQRAAGVVTMDRRGLAA